jgi:hypothetical protein
MGAEATAPTLLSLLFGYRRPHVVALFPQHIASGTTGCRTDHEGAPLQGTQRRQYEHKFQDL